MQKKKLESGKPGQQATSVHFPWAVLKSKIQALPQVIWFFSPKAREFFQPIGAKN